MRVKGTAVLTLPLFIKEKYGKEAFDKWLAALSDEAKDVYAFPILSSSWFPVKEILVEPTRKICDLFYNGKVTGGWDSGRFSADYSLKGIYKMFVRFGSVKFLIDKSSAILPTYYDSCRIEVKEFSDNKSVLHISEFPVPDAIIDSRIGGWVERALEISGCKDIRVVISQSLAKGDPVTELKISWR